MDLWPAFAIGFFGSFHCVGMCGPIALALPGRSRKVGSQLFQKLLYNFGRILTYTLFGAIIGFAGHGLVFAGFQRPLSIFLGLSIILVIMIPRKYISGIQRLPGISDFFVWLRLNIQRLFKLNGNISHLTIGVLNGFLPCGFVYAGLATSMTTGSVINGMLFMALFGLGTFPVMMAMSLAPGFISLKMRNRINRFLPYLGILLGLLLIARGLMISEH